MATNFLTFLKSKPKAISLDNKPTTSLSTEPEATSLEMKTKEILTSQQEKDLIRSYFEATLRSKLPDDKVIGCLVSVIMGMLATMSLSEKAFYVEKIGRFMKEQLTSNQDNYEK